MNKDQMGRLFIIEHSSASIGYFYLTFSYTLQFHGKDCFLDEFYIKPEFRRMGIGTEALKFIEAYLKQNNFKAIHLIVYNHNEPAYKYYIKNGFCANKANFMTKKIF